MNASSDTKTLGSVGGEAGSIGVESVGQEMKGGAGSGILTSDRRRVLVVDDEKGVIAALRRLLRREDYELVTASTGAEALEVLEAEPVSLVISDYRMPGMTGVELLREIRKRWPNTLRIILSGYSEVDAIITAVNEGEIYKFISKPWNDEGIKLHVRRALEQYELQAENERLSREIAAQNERLRELNTILEQRAADASSGLTSTQDSLENVGLGVLAVDASGLVVWANRRANEIISAGKSELIGIPTEIALPRALYDVVCSARRFEGVAVDCVVHDGKSLQCRVTPLVVSGGCRGSVIALWEEVR